jgi:heterogeneous nuclear rnp K-like protein 2
MEATEVHQTTVAADEPMTDAYVDTIGEQEPMDATPKTEEEYAASMLTLRAIVSSKEAGVIIGKAGKNVADLRDETGVKAGVSKVVPGVHDRVLTVTGPLQGTARAYAIVAKGLLEGAPQMGMGGVVSNNGTHRKSSNVPSTVPKESSASLPKKASSAHVSTQLNQSSPNRGARMKPTSRANFPSAVRLLISHNQMGTIIGRQGLKIKHIQDASGVRMVAQKEMLPQSTERIVEVQGTPEGIEKAVWEIGKCLIDDWQRGTGTVLYNPAVRASVGGSQPVQQNNNNSAGTGNGYNSSRQYNRTGNGADFSDNSGYNSRRSNSDAGAGGRGYPLVTEDGDEIQTQNISIPADMVGCIIGRAGSKITEIRRSSGARISIAKAPHDETGERMFTIMGSATANEKALYLLYENLEAEKTRRSQLPQE